MDRYEQIDVTFAQTREGDFLRKLSTAVEQLDVDAFTDVVCSCVDVFTSQTRPACTPSACCSNSTPLVSCNQVREYDEISRLDAQKTSLLLEAKTKIKESQDDIT